MRFAYFPGCKIPFHMPEYGAGVRAVCAALGVELVEPEFSCCGWPARHENFLASMYTAARNLALARAEGLDILTPCKCCFGNLMHARHRMARSPELAGRIRDMLAAEGLPDAQPESGGTRVLHLLTVLDEHVGAERLAEAATRPLTGLTVACHYGCHALRPSDVTDFDDPLAPTVFERTIRALGADTVDWDLRLECCGHPLRGRDDAVSEALLRKKLSSAEAAGADVVATACTYCQMQFDTERMRLPAADPVHAAPPAVLVTDLAARALGLATGADHGAGFAPGARTAMTDTSNT